jgi:hypothetical protein
MISAIMAGPATRRERRDVLVHATPSPILAWPGNTRPGRSRLGSRRHRTAWPGPCPPLLSAAQARRGARPARGRRRSTSRSMIPRVFFPSRISAATMRAVNRRLRDNSPGPAASRRATGLACSTTTVGERVPEGGLEPFASLLAREPRRPGRRICLDHVTPDPPAVRPSSARPGLRDGGPAPGRRGCA